MVKVKLLVFFLCAILFGDLRFARAEDVYVVMLRPPKEKYENPLDMRSDPFWHCGSFGLTGCHGRNLLHTNSIDRLIGQRVAFIQGGRGDKFPMRVVYLTPPIQATQKHSFMNEINWDPAVGLPFKYSKAPLFIDQQGNTDFPFVLEMVGGVKRDRWKGKTGSKFRSYSRPLKQEFAEQMITNYEAHLAKASAEDFITHYTDALPYIPPFPDTNREQTFAFYLRMATAIGRYYSDKNFAKECMNAMILEKTQQ